MLRQHRSISEGRPGTSCRPVSPVRSPDKHSTDQLKLYDALTPLFGDVGRVTFRACSSRRDSSRQRRAGGATQARYHDPARPPLGGAAHQGTYALGRLLCGRLGHRSGPRPLHGDDSIPGSLRHPRRAGTQCARAGDIVAHVRAKRADRALHRTPAASRVAAASAGDGCSRTCAPTSPASTPITGRPATTASSRGPTPTWLPSPACLARSSERAAATRSQLTAARRIADSARRGGRRGVARPALGLRPRDPSDHEPPLPYVTERAGATPGSLVVDPGSLSASARGQHASRRRGGRAPPMPCSWAASARPPVIRWR